MESAVVVFNIVSRGFSDDIEVPLDITANDLIKALNEAYALNIDISDIKKCYLKAERPIALIRGGRTLAEFGIRSGSEIFI